MAGTGHLSPDPSTPVLTPRELEILDLAAEGMSNAEIGTKLGISPLTVKKTLANAAKQLGVGSRAGMVGLAYRHGLFEPALDAPLLRLPELPVEVWAALPLIAGGMSDLEIGSELGVSDGVAHGRVIRLLREFGVDSRARLIRVAVDCGVLTPRLGLSPSATGFPVSAGILPVREARALALVARGLSDQAAAGVLGVSEAAAGNLVRGAVAKLGGVSRANAVYLACGLGILQPSGVLRAGVR